jgi:hypothetical protein
MISSRTAEPAAIAESLRSRRFLRRLFVYLPSARRTGFLFFFFRAAPADDTGTTGFRSVLTAGGRASGLFAPGAGASARFPSEVEASRGFLSAAVFALRLPAAFPERLRAPALTEVRHLFAPEDIFSPREGSPPAADAAFFPRVEKKLAALPDSRRAAPGIFPAAAAAFCPYSASLPFDAQALRLMAESPPASVFISPPAALMIDKSAAAHLRSDCRSFPAAVLILSELNCILLLFRLPAAVVVYVRTCRLPGDART